MKLSKLVCFGMAAILSFSILPQIPTYAQEVVQEEEVLEESGQHEKEESLDQTIKEMEESNRELFSEVLLDENISDIRELEEKVLPEDVTEIIPEENVTSVNKTEEDYEYKELDDGTLEITEYTGSDTEIVVPAEIDGKKVSKIGCWKREIYHPTGPNSGSVEVIWGGAFEGCRSLTRVELPAGLTEIDSTAFEGCSSLMEIIVDENNPEYMSQDGVLYDKNQKRLICCPGGKTGNIVINKSVTEIGAYAFSGCSSLTGIELPENLTKIGYYGVFENCSSLTGIELPAGLTEISSSAFENCSSLTRIELPAGLTEIGSRAFENCSSLTGIELPAGLTEIGSRAFENCSSLTGIELPAGLTEIGYSAFGNCSSLKEIIVDRNNPEYMSQDGVLYDKNQKRLICCPGEKTGNIVINKSVTEIDDRAFSGCSSLTGIELPAGLTEIGYGVFENCSSLTGIELPAGLTEIGSRAFENCSSLTGIELPAGLTEIGYSAFENCSSLTGIELPAGLTEIGSSAFENCSNLSSIKFSKSLTNVGEDAFKGCASSISVKISEGVTSILSKTFFGNNNLIHIDLPEGITKIEWGAFENCSSLRSIKLPKSLIEIGSRAFKGCESLANIDLPEGITKIEWGAFENCRSLRSIKLPQGLTEIEKDTFSRCISLKNIEIPEGVTKIKSAFVSCESLSSIELPQGLISIEGINDLQMYNGAFAMCSSLKSVIIPESVKDMGREIFLGCNPDLTLYVIKGSYAESYAKLYKLKYSYFTSCVHNYQLQITKATTKKDGTRSEVCTKCGDIKSITAIYAVKTIQLAKTSYTYNGKAMKPAVSIKDSKGKNLKSKTDYTISYAKGRKNVGNYTVTIKLKGNYSGTVKKTFTIVPKGTSISKVTPRKKGFTVKWKKQATQVTGYEIAYSTDSKFPKKNTKIVSVRKNNVVSNTVNKLKTKKKYYLRIRTYQTVKGKKYYSSWSKVKNITTKR